VNVNIVSDAHALLCQTLTARGNVLSGGHRAALRHLIEVMAEYVSGSRRGRWAFALDTGLGKTTAAACFIATLHRAGSPAAVAVAASKVEALCEFKRDLLCLGVPERLIGLKHSIPTASLASTGDESRQFQLVTHARVRSGNDLDLFCSFGETRRSLMIYDETLWRSDTFSISLRDLSAAIGAWNGARDPSLRCSEAEKAALEYLSECLRLARATVEELKEAGDADGVGQAIRLPLREVGELEAMAIGIKASGILRPYQDQLDALLEISQQPLRVLQTEGGVGVLFASEAVPPELENVLVLDASWGIRKLAHFDTSVRRADRPASRVKTYDDVRVVQLLAAGGRSTVETGYRSNWRETAAMSKEVTDIVKEHWDEPGATLVFTFKERGGLSITRELQRDLAAAGIPLDHCLPSGRPKVRFLTYGDETSLNGYEDCTTVILAGVLHRSMIDLAAAARGQSGRPDTPTPSRLLRELVESEVAHTVYQAASRGAMRKVRDGRALPMHLYVVHRSVQLRELLKPVMPGASWSFRTPKHLATARRQGRVAELCSNLILHLQDVPHDQRRVPTRALRAVLGVESTGRDNCAFADAIAEVAEGAGWAREGHALVRRDGQFFFGAADSCSP
jgi:hypothetical protein